MEHPLITYFNQHISLTVEETEYLLQNVRFRSFETSTILLEEGAISKAFYFVIEGGVRMYYLVDGVEKTTFFYSKNEFVSSYESFTKQVPAKHYIATLKNTTLAQFDATTVAEILERFPRFDFLARVAMEEELSIYQKMIADFVTLNAEQRYQKLIKEKPQLLQQIPQYHLATYLGVSPETLSRIRKRISEK